MKLLQKQIESLCEKFDNIGAKALVIRDFWKAKTDEFTFKVDANTSKDPWLVHKLHQFNILFSQSLTSGEESTKKISGGLNGVDTLYKEILYHPYEGEYKHSIQDRRTMQILDEVLSKYSEEIYIDIFSFTRSDEDKIEYLETTNPLLSLLRLEYDGFIEIVDLPPFRFPLSKKDIFYIEGKIKFKKLKGFTGSSKKTLATSKQMVLQVDNGAVLVGDREIGRITLGTEEYYFFECLYENYDRHVSHQDIVDYIVNKNSTINDKTKHNADIGRFCSGIKVKIPKKIKVHITAPNKGYILCYNPKK